MNHQMSELGLSSGVRRSLEEPVKKIAKILV
jgi:hypothetical protein